jgi:hypothetical protein
VFTYVPRYNGVFCGEGLCACCCTLRGGVVDAVSVARAVGVSKQLEHKRNKGREDPLRHLLKPFPYCANYCPSLSAIPNTCYRFNLILVPTVASSAVPRCLCELSA